MRIIIEQNYDKVSYWAANYIVHCIEKFAPSADRPFLLGLPTGSTPLGMYRELVSLHRSGKVSFRHVITFNMDEYVGLARDDPQSYYYFMYKHFFSQVDILPEQINIPDGTHAELEALEEECKQYEERIRKLGGIQLFVGGLGADGHIAFNEPGSSLNSRTRIKTLTEHTRLVNAHFFENDITRVPKFALTVGVATIMDAQEVMLLVSGGTKARALRHCVEESISHMWTASCMQLHQQALFVCDDDACTELKYGTVQYFKGLEQ